MLGNIVDRRTDRLIPECVVVFEPSTHDNAERADGTEWFSEEEAMNDPAYFYAKNMLDTTIREAVLHTETTWSFPVTMFLYDKGLRPLDGRKMDTDQEAQEGGANLDAR